MLLQCVNLVTEIIGNVLVLLAQSGDLSFSLHDALLQVSLQLVDVSLQTLVCISLKAPQY